MVPIKCSRFDTAAMLLMGSVISECLWCKSIRILLPVPAVLAVNFVRHFVKLGSVCVCVYIYIFPLEDGRTTEARSG
jgi:hypothetical protein